jgi:hypothetical protein
MILKASQRSGARELGAHLLKTEENEHVEIHEVSGFVSESVPGAMREANALSKGTKCQQHLFSVSLNPPAGEIVEIAAFEKALRLIEEKMGLTGQPRVVVFHEKEGRRHCHAVWSRIDAQTMTAKPLPFFKRRLNEIAKQLYLDHGWELPKGFADTQKRDPLNFTLEEWQKAKRAGLDAKQLKASAQEAWAMSDNAASFGKAMEERGLFLARGDRRGHVAVTINGDVFAVAQLLDRKTKEITARLGDPAKHASVTETVSRLSGEMGARMRNHIAEAKRIASNAMKPLAERREAMKAQHQLERQHLREGVKARADAELRERAGRVRSGVAGAWDFLTGRYFAVRRQNESELVASMIRDRGQIEGLLRDQMRERSELQNQIGKLRTRHASQVLSLYRDAAQFRQMRAGLSQERQPGVTLER